MESNEMQNVEAKKRHYTVQERATMIRDIDHLISNGMPRLEAIKRAGIHMTSYYAWKKSLSKRRYVRSSTRAEKATRATRATRATEWLSRSVVESILTDPNLNADQRVKMLTAYAQA